ncbi:MAG: hypothetical protein HY22_05255 [[Candidatus Thermochlorobacteriaceae] bacterium GBChlB]|nr:MAG: hypothetical protein HY22_05255 [[Candidatus Thermochlorobacteriaceae] bacterium GBChlB]
MVLLHQMFTFIGRNLIMNNLDFWRRWVVANALGELVGLGATFSIGFLAFSATGEPRSVGAVLLLAGATVLTGAIEGAVLGWAQWRAMRTSFSISLKDWLAATLAGALSAWFLGIVPSTLMSIGEQSGGASSVEPPLVVMMFLGGAMGLVLGVVLAIPQWLVLKKHVEHAAWWIPANSLAWLFGMPIIFGGIDLASSVDCVLWMIVGVAATLFLTGATVGAIHGAFLTRFVEQSVSVRSESM